MIALELPEEPVGPRAATLPKMLPPLRVNDYFERWSVNSLKVTGKVRDWEGAKGRHLVAVDDATSPTHATTGGALAVGFDGIDDILALADLPNIHGVTIVGRVTGAAGTGVGIWDRGDGATGVVRNSNNALGIFYGGAAATMSGADVGIWSMWHSWFGTQGFLRNNAATSGAVTPTNPGLPNALRLGRLGNTFGQFAVREVILWDRILTGGEIDTLRTDLKAAYPGMV